MMKTMALLSYKSMHLLKFLQTPGCLIALRRNNGVLKPGEMCLVLGCPGAGCTTFLKSISNQREGYAFVGGDVRYAGISAAEMTKLYKGEVVYNQEG
jgi:ATP-binding cassette subfamily G (WHITE) protein 2 (SNQ2)